MNKHRNHKIFLFKFLILFYLGFAGTGTAQENDGMLIFQVDGNKYIRKNFDKDGELKNYQTIEIGQLNKTGDNYETKMTTITYDADSTLKDASQTSLVCTPASRQVLMGIFPFAGGKSNKSLIVKMDEDAIMYPLDWRNFSTLKDFNFSLNFSGGAAGFFGTKSKVSITNRRVMPSKNLFGVSGKLALKAYVMGLKIATINYDFYEEIDEESGIIKQKFTEESGAYFTIELEE